MNTTTIYGGAVAMTTCAHARVWRERPVTRRLAAVIAPAQGTTLSVAGQLAGKPAGQAATTGPVTVPATFDATPNSMDASSFRTGRPPV